MMGNNSWKDTQLWNYLKNTDVSLTLETCMPEIEEVLKSGNTSPIDFTLHDANHSFRVAEMVCSLMPNGISEYLTIYDAAQILLASYLHDIGMTPNRSTAERHRTYLASAENNILSPNEHLDLQRWLDTYWGGIEAPIQPDDRLENGILKIDQIHAYYCRHKHNDWSEEWIRSNLTARQHPLYQGWIDDLVTLCRSHHEGLAELKTSRFDPRIVGNRGDSINLRYLAALLRLADVMEFDPERTPEIILSHRDISPTSRIYWQRDHHISIAIDSVDKQILLTARTPNAKIHHAVCEVVNSINQELYCCSTLNYDGLYANGRILNLMKDRYKWHWPAFLYTDVRERDESFVYIDGAFRPDKSKILQLLSGTRLYGTIWASVRELLQNAVDAVREQIALERLLQDKPADSKWEQALGLVHRIQLRFDQEGEHYYLTCSDNGVGMNKSLIENHLLVSGSKPRPELVALERAAVKSGFTVGRTGQFGIGLLSYFMIGRSISLSTRRSTEAGDTDGNGWKFEIESLDGHGELKKISRSSKGTDVRIELRDEIIDNDPRLFLQRLKSYIDDTFTYTPCVFEIIDNVFNEDFSEVQPGWLKSKKYLTKSLTRSIRNTKKNDNIITIEKQEKEMELNRIINKMREDTEKKIDLYGPKEIFLDSKSGLARIWIPFVKYDEEISFALFNFTEGEIWPIADDKGIIQFFDFNTYISWKGFLTDETNRSFHHAAAVVELNLNSDAEISVDRNRLVTSSDHRKELFSVIFQQYKEIQDESKSKFSLMNAIVIARQSGARSIYNYKFLPIWIYPLSESYTLKDISFPCIDIVLPSFKKLNFCDRETTIDGENIQILHSVPTGSYSEFQISQYLTSGELSFARFDGYVYIATRWNDPTTFLEKPKRTFCSTFPDGWQDIAYISTSARPFFNEAHCITSTLDDQEIGLEQNFQFLDEQLLKSINKRNSARCFLLSCHSFNIGQWQAIYDNFTEEYCRILELANLPDGELRIWRHLGPFDNDQTIIIGQSGPQIRKSASVINSRHNTSAYLKFADDKNYLLPEHPIIRGGQSIFN